MQTPTTPQRSSIHGKDLEQWCDEFPVLRSLIEGSPLLWENPRCQSAAPVLSALQREGIGYDRIEDAAARLERFRPCIKAAFPVTAGRNGLIESPLLAVPNMKEELEKRHQLTIPGQLLLKCDSHLPISGSIKARGGIYEVLKLAETIALDHGLLAGAEDYFRLLAPQARELFHGYHIAVGSTGNLGLSIGIMGARLGFQVTVHMSHDARTWKKDLLRSHGVEVIEHSGDYSSAVSKGRNQAERDPKCHFVDDEASTDLFYGYAVAALRLRQQLTDAGVTVTGARPLFVYLPCGVGGGPGGIAFGLKHVFGDHVRCYFCEPTSAACVLLGLVTQLHNRVSLVDFGIKLQTEADGLAVARPSGFVCRVMNRLLDGIVTVSDDTMFRHLAMLKDTENIDMEPSALAPMSGPLHLEGRNPAAAHLVWGTGGAMVPQEEQERYYQRGKALL